MRTKALLGGVLVGWFLASPARGEPAEYSFAHEPARADVSGGGHTYTAWRLVPGGQSAVTAKGPGELKIFYFQEYSPGKPFPTDVRLLVTMDGTGKMFPLTPKPLPGLKFITANADKTIPAAPLPVVLAIPAGEHQLVIKLAATSDLGGVIAFPEAKAKGGDLDLDLDVAAAPPPPKSFDLALDDDLDLPPAPPPKGKDAKVDPKAKPAALAMDLDLDMPPPPPAPGRTPPKVASLDLDLDDPLPAGAALPKPTGGLLADNKANVKVASAPPPAMKPADALPPPKPFLPPAVANRDQKPPPKPPAVALSVPVEAPPMPPPPPPEPEVPAGPPPPLGRIEAGVRAGYALARGKLNTQGQPMGMFEIGVRLEDMPSVRITFAGGWTMLSGSFAGFEPVRGRGTYYQTTSLIPVEVGATYEIVSLGRLTPYVGLALSGGIAQTQLQRYSLQVQQTSGASLGGTATFGLRLQVSTALLLVEARQNESFATPSGVTRFGASTLSTTTFDGGLLFSF